MELDLVLVLPVYNEEDCIVAVMREWTTMLSHLGIRYQMIVLNDGSKDRTAARLAEFSGDSHVQVIDKANAGHGPTVLQGYRLAVDRAIWAFQCDSDNEMPADHFPELWARREHYDALFGTRTDRVQTLPRKIVSAASRMTVRILFGPGVVDVNTPYRLMRCSVLKQIIEQIPEDTFAPNVIISGAFAKAAVPIWNHPVPHQPRRTGVSMMQWKLCKSAAKAFWQTLSCRPRLDLRRIERATAVRRSAA